MDAAELRENTADVFIYLLLLFSFFLHPSDPILWVTLRFS